jgi:hypothetical protein
MSDPNMSEWRRKWMATGFANFEKRTGRPTDEWGLAAIGPGRE